ncbi:hypothetical protein ACFPER_09490 [Agromyces aurantiacus]|uniref:Arsenate reductase n=1 Tax=Agromyces aurantiacus TaxID=165814 RepID=A0ABV9R4H9_9MICO|nr:hypothetical protein [Agromyces aurantiacus]MBM7503706.1 hypothetical protein [Agromyces aurantiacus]
MTESIPVSWAPESCALPTVERPLREAAFAALFHDHLTRVRRPAPAVAELVLDRANPARVRELVALEASCCSFFTFDVREAAGRVRLNVGVPSGQVPVLDALVASAVAASGAEVTP